jgi:uncharacterized protein (UPF0335 family)
LKQRYPQLPFPSTLVDWEYPMRGDVQTTQQGREAVPHRLLNDREVALNQQVKDLIQKLGEAIHESVSESDQISGVVREISEQGFDVLLMLEATIGLNEVDNSDESDAESENDAGTTIDGGPFTSRDLTFLKSLRITTDEQDALGSGESMPPPQSLPPPDQPSSGS